MPTLDWIGKKAVVSLQCGVPCRLTLFDRDRNAETFKQIPC